MIGALDHARRRSVPVLACLLGLACAPAAASLGRPTAPRQEEAAAATAPPSPARVVLDTVHAPASGPPWTTWWRAGGSSP